MAAVVKASSGIFGGLIIWGLAPKRVERLTAQLEAAPGCQRARVALEWYVRIWDRIDAGISRVDGGVARRFWEMYYREGMDRWAIGRALGYSRDGAQGCFVRKAALLRALVDEAEIARLTAWRVRFSRERRVPFGAAMRGFEIEAGSTAYAERLGDRMRTAVVVDWREVERAMRSV